MMSLIKLNWGTGIAMFYSLAAFGLFYAVYQSTKIDRSLVVQNYYEEDIAYQSKYNKLSNTKKLGSTINLVYNQKTEHLDFTLPPHFKIVSGIIKFYKPNDVTLDFTIDLNHFLNHNDEVDFKQLANGKWKIIVDFKADGKTYLLEKDIFI